MTYTIHRYPAELIDIVHVADCPRVTLRPILPQDAELMQSFFRTLSDESRQNRFHRALHELPTSLLNQFTNVDYDTHLALLAEVFVDGSEVIVGEARYIRDEDPARAEFAMAIADEWQGKGLGWLLLSFLEGRAAAEGIKVLFGRTLPGNLAMQGLAQKAGFKCAPDLEEPDTVRLQKRVDSPRATSAEP
jgi:RimJ/RimL family protein N-acetyltransferase